MRLFIALEIPEDSKKELKNLQENLKIILPQAKLTDPEKLHLTIAFIGEQPDQSKMRFMEVIKKAAEETSRFAVIPAYLDGFPHRHNAKTLWVGVKGDVDKLYLLRHHIKDGLKKLHLDVDERRYVPHIALAKIENFKMTPEIEKQIDDLTDKNFEPIYVSSIKLFESIPNHGFHQHNTLFEASLR